MFLGMFNCLYVSIGSESNMGLRDSLHRSPYGIIVLTKSPVMILCDSATIGNSENIEIRYSGRVR